VNLRAIIVASSNVHTIDLPDMQIVHTVVIGREMGKAALSLLINYQCIEDGPCVAPYAACDR
jgi:hypothetical protein